MFLKSSLNFDSCFLKISTFFFLFFEIFLQFIKDTYHFGEVSFNYSINSLISKFKLEYKIFLVFFRKLKVDLFLMKIWECFSFFPKFHLVGKIFSYKVFPINHTECNIEDYKFLTRPSLAKPRSSNW